MSPFLFVGFVFAPVQDEDQRWDGPEEADPVSGGVHGAPREDEASSTGWVRELSSEDGGHAALHRGSGGRSRVSKNGQIPPAAPDRRRQSRVCLTRVLCHDEGENLRKDGCRVHLSTGCIYVKSEYCRWENIVILGSWWHLQPVSVSQGKVELSRAVVFPVTWQQEHQEAEISCQSWRFTPFMTNKTENRSHLWGKSIQKGLKSNKCH